MNSRYGSQGGRGRGAATFTWSKALSASMLQSLPKHTHINRPSCAVESRSRQTIQPEIFAVHNWSQHCVCLDLCFSLCACVCAWCPVNECINVCTHIGAFQMHFCAMPFSIRQCDLAAAFVKWDKTKANRAKQQNQKQKHAHNSNKFHPKCSCEREWIKWERRRNENKT